MKKVVRIRENLGHVCVSVAKLLTMRVATGTKVLLYPSSTCIDYIFFVRRFQLLLDQNAFCVPFDVPMGSSDVLQRLSSLHRVCCHPQNPYMSLEGKWIHLRSEL